MFRTSRVLSLSLSLETVGTVLCALHGVRVVPHSVPSAVDPVLRIICVLQGERNAQEGEKGEEEAQDRRHEQGQAGRKGEEKREEWKEETKPKKKKTEERNEEEKKDPKGKSRSIVAEDDAPEQVQEIKAKPAQMAALPRRAPRSTHMELKNDPPSPCGSVSGSSSQSSSSNNTTSSSSSSSSSRSESNESAQKTPVHQKGALKAAKTQAPENGKESAKPHFLLETHGRPPSKVLTGQTRYQKFTRWPPHVRSIEILKSFFSNEYGFLLGTFVHHYKNWCGQLKSATAAEVCVCTTFGVLCMHLCMDLCP